MAADTTNRTPDYDSWTKIDSIIRLNELLGMEDGWLDGKGVAPDAKKVDELITRMGEWCAESMPQPTIAPTTEGNIEFEWYFDGVGASGEIILSNGMMWFSCHDGEPGNEGYEEMIDMTRKVGWERLAALLEARPTHCNYVNLANT